MLGLFVYHVLEKREAVLEYIVPCPSNISEDDKIRVFSKLNFFLKN